MKTILFIIGSLRKGSFNRKLAEEAERMLDGRAKVEYLDYSDVPLMNQDFEFPAPEAVRKVRKRWQKPMPSGYSLLNTITVILDI